MVYAIGITLGVMVGMLSTTPITEWYLWKNKSAPGPYAAMVLGFMLISVPQVIDLGVGDFGTALCIALGLVPIMAEMNVMRVLSMQAHDD